MKICNWDDNTDTNGEDVWKIQAIGNLSTLFILQNTANPKRHIGEAYSRGSVNYEDANIQNLFKSHEELQGEVPERKGRYFRPVAYLAKNTLGDTCILVRRHVM